MASTVLVNLRRPWFGPDGSRYDPEDNPHSFPASYADEPKLEKAEGESDADFKRRSEKQKYAVLPSTAEVVGSGKSVMTLRKTANGSVILDPQAVDGDVKSVGNTVEEAPIADRHDDVHRSTPVAKAEKAAEEANEEVGGNPRKSGPREAK